MFRIFGIIALLFSLAFGAVNINTADKKELMSLPGVGAKKADAIIEYRDKQKFEKIEDVKKVKGISDKVFQKIKDNIAVDGK